MKQLLRISAEGPDGVETIRNLPGAAWNHPTSSSSSLLLPSLHIEIKGMIERAKHAGHTRLCGFKPDVCVLTCVHTAPPRCLLCQSVSQPFAAASSAVLLIPSLHSKSTFKRLQCVVGLRGKLLKPQSHKYIFYSDFNLSVEAASSGWPSSALHCLCLYFFSLKPFFAQPYTV